MCIVVSDIVLGMICATWFVVYQVHLPPRGSQCGDDHAVRLKLVHIREVVLTTHLAVVTAVFDLLRHIHPSPGGSVQT